MQTLGFSMSKERLEKVISYLESKLAEARQQLELLTSSSVQQTHVKNEEHKTGPLKRIAGDRV
jgi:exonuclease VII small subunit